MPSGGRLSAMLPRIWNLLDRQYVHHSYPIYHVTSQRILLLYQDFFSTGIAGALGTVSDHINNNTLDIFSAISLIGEISSTDLDESYSFAIEQDTEVYNTYSCYHNNSS